MDSCLATFNLQHIKHDAAMTMQRIHCCATSDQAECKRRTSRLATQTALFALNPDPKPSCQITSPRLMPRPSPLGHDAATPDSWQASEYHTELLDVFPKLFSVRRLAAIVPSLSLSCFSTSSRTPRPPQWMQKWRNAVVKSGTATFFSSFVGAWAVALSSPTAAFFFS